MRAMTRAPARIKGRRPARPDGRLLGTHGDGMVPWVPKAYVWADPKLVRTLLASEVSIAHPTTAEEFAPDGVSADQIKDVVVLQGPDYWWWADSRLPGPRFCSSCCSGSDPSSCCRRCGQS